MSICISNIGKYRYNISSIYMCISNTGKYMNNISSVYMCIIIQVNI
jgi:hypothetical protein